MTMDNLDNIIFIECPASTRMAKTALNIESAATSRTSYANAIDLTT